MNFYEEKNSYFFYSFKNYHFFCEKSVLYEDLVDTLLIQQRMVPLRYKSTQNSPSSPPTTTRSGSIITAHIADFIKGTLLSTTSLARNT